MCSVRVHQLEEHADERCCGAKGGLGAETAMEAAEILLIGVEFREC